MSNEFVSLKQLAAEIGMDRSHARRYVLKLGITPHKRRTPDSGNQLTLALSQEEAERVRSRRSEQGFLANSMPVETGVGVFYVIQLVPELDPKRIKLGFADDVASRLTQHRTSAPTAELVKSWPCKRTWEATVMDTLTAIGCRLILNEVFECDNLAQLIATGDALFAVLPAPASRPELADVSPHNT
ncbi:MAG: hypothetical protein L6Q92_02000 [Phycisphaerae bacterium]|nr:hypothetical protein [Phycisphaerae bacterium]